MSWRALHAYRLLFPFSRKYPAGNDGFRGMSRYVEIGVFLSAAPDSFLRKCPFWPDLVEEIAYFLPKHLLCLVFLENACGIDHSSSGTKLIWNPGFGIWQFFRALENVMGGNEACFEKYRNSWKIGLLWYERKPHTSQITKNRSFGIQTAPQKYPKSLK